MLAETGSSDELSSCKSSPDKHPWLAPTATSGKLFAHDGLFTDAGK